MIKNKTMMNETGGTLFITMSCSFTCEIFRFVLKTFPIQDFVFILILLRYKETFFFFFFKW